MNQEKIQSLINKMSNEEQVEVWEISHLKNDAGKPDVQAALLHVLQNDKELRVRIAAAEVLAPHVESGACNGESTPVKAAFLHALQNDEEWYVRTIVAKALKPHVESGACNGESTPVKAAFVHLLQNDSDSSVSGAAAKALKDHVNDPAVKAAFLRALRDHTSPLSRSNVAEVLKDHVESAPYDEQSTPVKAALMRALLRDDHWCVRREAAMALKDHGNDPAVQELLVHALRNDNDWSVRLIAAKALIDHGNDPEAQELLVEALLRDDLWYVRQAAAMALKDHVESDLCDEQSTPVKAALMRALLRDDNSIVREAAAEALKDHGNDPAVQAAFVCILGNFSESPTFRLKAAEILAPYAARDPEINGVMVKAFKNDPAPKVRQVAAREADCSAADLTGVNFSGLPHLPQVDEKTTVIPPEWCKPKLLMGIGNAFDRNKATSTDIAETKARFEGVPPEELERFLNQLSTLQRFGLRMMLQQGK
ncbi:MAG: HEAT repeat domain-containing protein, partial [Holosporaceae bacterium]